MLIKEFYKDVGNLFIKFPQFNDILPNDEDYEILNVFFVDKYAGVKIDFDPSTQTLNMIQGTVLYTMLKHYEYYKAIYNSIQTQYNPITESVDIETTHTKTGDDTATKSGTDGIQRTGTDSTNGTTNSTDGGTTTNTNNTFDNAAYRESDKTTFNNNGNTTTNNTITHNTTDTHTYNTEDKTTYDTEEKTTTRGHNQLDYARVLKEMYESKKINLYDVIINDVADVICEMLYIFD